MQYFFISCRLRLRQELYTYIKSPSINAQWQSMPIKIIALIQNASKCRSLLINRHWDQCQKSFDFICRCLYSIFNHFSSMKEQPRILIGIDWHWSALDIDRGSPDTSYKSLMSVPRKVGQMRNDRNCNLPQNDLTALDTAWSVVHRGNLSYSDDSANSCLILSYWENP